MNVDAPTAEAESSTEQLFHALGAHRTLILMHHQGSTYRTRLAQSTSITEIQRQSTLIRLLSITEAFALELLLREMDSAFSVVKHSGIARLWSNASTRNTGTWSEQQKAYKDWLDVKFDYRDIEGFIEARNSIAHGLGTLTRRQKANESSTLSKLKAVGIETQSGKIMLSEEILESATLACRSVIHSLDKAVRYRASNYR